LNNDAQLGAFFIFWQRAQQNAKSDEFRGSREIRIPTDMKNDFLCIIYGTEVLLRMWRLHFK